MMYNSTGKRITCKNLAGQVMTTMWNCYAICDTLGRRTEMSRSGSRMSEQRTDVYGYNAENRPVLWTRESDGKSIEMLFDRMGRRVEYVETTGGPGSVPATTNVHHRFVYDGYLCIQRLDATANNLVELSFAWDPTEPIATRPLVMQRNGGWNFFYTHDGNKNVSDVVSFQQARGVPAHYEYAPFGAVTAVTTNAAITAFSVAETNPFRFSSEYADDALGLVYYNYRHYDAANGRWVSRDAIEEYGGLSLYEYVKNSFGFDVLGLNR